MKQHLLVFAAVAAILPAYSQGPQKGPDQKKQLREVKAIGCVRRGVEGGCLVLKTLDGKTTYNIFANPRPEVGIVISIDGTEFRGVTSCMEGTPITVTTWEATGEKCQN
jgi:hypothetical protein